MRPVLPLLLVLLLWPAGSSAQEVFSWWRRGLIDLDLRAGSWVEVVDEEMAEGELSTQRIRVTVLADAAEGGHWIELWYPEQGEGYVLRVGDEEELRTAEILDGLQEIYHLLPAGAVKKEDVGKVREQRLLRRQFEDPFLAPAVTRRAMSDTVMAGQRLSREEVRLSETRRDTVDMGRRRLVYRNEIESVAEISPQIPVFGLLRARTTTVLSAEGEGRDTPPPLVTRRELRCVDFGRKVPAPGLPDGVRALRSPPEGP